MGLDMYAYVGKPGQMDEYYTAEGDYVDGEWKPHKNSVARPRDIAYWRKHPNLHGWMEKLAERKGLKYNTFNGVELELTFEDINELEIAINKGQLPSTSGFFFGDEADEYYKEQDLEFIKQAKADLFCGLQVFYNSSW